MWNRTDVACDRGTGLSALAFTGGLIDGTRTAEVLGAVCFRGGSREHSLDVTVLTCTSPIGEGVSELRGKNTRIRVTTSARKNTGITESLAEGCSHKKGGEEIKLKVNQSNQKHTSTYTVGAIII